MMKGLISFLMALCLAFSCLAEPLSPDAAAGSAAAAGAVRYARYAENIAAPGEKPISWDYDQLKGAEGVFSDDGEALIMQEGDYIRLPLQAEGAYQIWLSYDPDPNGVKTTQVSLLLDGALPFREAAGCPLDRLYRDAAPISQDGNGNDIRPSQREILLNEPLGAAPRGFLSCALRDGAGYQDGALQFDLTGKENITLYMARGAVRLRGILLQPEENPADYGLYAASFPENAAPALGEGIVIEAEGPSAKTDISLVAATDRSSPLTTPYKGSKISLNMIGGTSWTRAGSRLEWQFTPEETGLYAIRFRSRQNYAQGFSSYRTLRLDGEIPFAQAWDMAFPYHRDWKISQIMSGDQECMFYFEKGRSYTLSLEVSLGEMGMLLSGAAQILDGLNGIYARLLMIMSASPDAFRDYNLHGRYPDLMENMLVQAEALEKLALDLEGLSGAAGADLAILRKIANELREFYRDEDLVAKQLGYLKDDIASLSDWINDAANRPLDLDKIYIVPAGSRLARANAAFFQSLFHDARLFFSSFTEDYNSLGADKEGETITVWLLTGRDQASLLSEIIRTGFTQYAREVLGRPVSVDLQLVTGGAILPALATGTGPDVLLGLDSTTVIDYALRHVAAPLSELCPDEEKLHQVLSRFRDSAVAGLSFQGEVYALPETQAMTVMFIRQDVLANLGIDAPTADNPWSWDDLIAVLPLLQQNNLTVLMDTSATNNSGLSGLGAFATLLYQRGGAIYEGEGENFGISTALHTEEAARAFDFWTSLYTEYGLPAVFNAPNRFRTGEAPIVINDLSLYNTLMVSAPEIRGLWTIAPVPGTVRNGEMDLSSYSVPGGSVVLSTSEHKQAAWLFIEWFTQAKTQESYGRDLESLLGASARYFSANVEAFSHLDWSSQEKAVLDVTGEWSRCVPQVAGGYHLARYVNNAFRNVHLGFMEEREALLYFAQVINDELTVKRLEFGLPTLEGGMKDE